MKDETKNIIKPFWSWNDKLNKEELENQITKMKENGIEGFFMHARGGLRTEYMGDEWFDMIEACLDKADELNMQAWAYDENGWPSGFGNGVVPALGLGHQQKSLKLLIWNADIEGKTNGFSRENIIALYRRTESGFIITDDLNEGVYVLYFEVNPYYIDVFNKETIAYFLKMVHDQYYERFKERFGTSLKGFFTDEPQFRSSPWSFVFPKEFKKTYGYELNPVLPLLFFEEEGYEAVRNDFENMVGKLLQESFVKQMYDWCTEHNCKLTGHMMNEHSLLAQMNSTNGVMPCYEYFHEPGMDHLKREISVPLQPKQVGSVAIQLGRKTLTETFALCGWDVSLNELKWIAQWQYVNGVTSLCPHLEGYSLRGLRKRDYPPSLFTQLPWFESVYGEFADYFTTLGALLDSEKDIAPVLVVHPIHSAFILHNHSNFEKLSNYSKWFECFSEELNSERVLHHYGDETIMEHHGSVSASEDGVFLVIGKCKYSSVLLPNIINLTTNTVKMLLEFAENGGPIYAVERLPEFENGRKTNLIDKLREVVRMCANLNEFKCFCEEAAPIKFETNNAAIHLTLKELSSDKKLLYLVNNTNEKQTITLSIQGSYEIYGLDILKETEEKLDTDYENNTTKLAISFSEYGSAVLTLLEKEEILVNKYSVAMRDTEEELVTLDSKFQIADCDYNAITLDKCTYRIDGGEWQPELAVINLQDELFKMWKPCNLDMQFTFEIADNFDFNSVNLCIEDPKNFEIVINDVPYTFNDIGYFVDHSIRQSNIGKLLKVGMNTIRLSCYYTQSEEVYFAKLTPGIHESVKNKLTYDMEIESIYLVGDFGVEMKESYVLGERRCLYGGKTFRLVKPVMEVDITDITHQGYWFFSGKMMLTQNVNIHMKEGKKYIISIEKLNAPAAQVYVNDVYAGNMMFAPFEVEITKLLRNGENKIAIIMYSGNRNLLGPHHKPEGESYSVCPGSFTNQWGWADNKNIPPWTDNYNFVLFGCEFKIK